MLSRHLITVIVLSCVSVLTSCTFNSPDYGNIAQYSAVKNRNSTALAMWQKDQTTLWQQLVHMSSKKLLQLKTTVNEPIKKGWIDLALISKKHSRDPKALANQIAGWEKQYPNHPARQQLPDDKTLLTLIDNKPPKQIAVLLPQQGAFGSAGQTVREGFLNAYYTNLPKVGEQKIKFYDTSNNTNLISLYNQAVSEGADVVIGPLVKNDVQQLSNNGIFNTPTLALNYSGRRFGPLPKNYFEFGLLPEDEVQQIALKSQEMNVKHALVIAPRNQWGKRLVAVFSKNWQGDDRSISETWFYASPSHYSQDIARLSKGVDIIFLFAQPAAARQIVPLLKARYTNNLPIFATSTIINDKTTLDDKILAGITVCDLPYNQQFNKTNQSTQSERNRLYAVGQDAYLLSQSINRLETLPLFPLYGATGALTLSNLHTIHRNIPCNKVSSS